MMKKFRTLLHVLLFCALCQSAFAFTGVGNTLFSNNISHISSGESFDWSTWDATNDGTTQQFYTAGAYGPTHLAATGNLEFVTATRKRTATQARTLGVYSIDDSDNSITEEDTFDSSIGDEGIFPSVVKLSDTRILKLWTGSGGHYLGLFEKDGAEITSELDTDDMTSVVTANRNFRSIARISDTLAIMFYSPASSSNYRAVIIDTSGDTISYGTYVDVGFSTSASRYGVMTVLDDTHIFVSVYNKAALITRSGSTLTVADTEDIISGGTIVSDMQGSCAPRDDQVVFVYESGTTTNAGIFEVDKDADTLTRGTALQINATQGMFNGPQEAGLVCPQEGIVIAAITHVSSQGSKVYRLNVAENNTITSDGIIKSLDGDHVVLRLMDNNARAVAITQDNQTSPVDQVSMTVLNAAD